MTLAGVPASGGWCVDSVNIDVNHMDMDVNRTVFVVILCRTFLTCLHAHVHVLTRRRGANKAPTAGHPRKRKHTQT